MIPVTTDIPYMYLPITTLTKMLNRHYRLNRNLKSLFQSGYVNLNERKEVVKGMTRKKSKMKQYQVPVRFVFHIDWWHCESAFQHTCIFQISRNYYLNKDIVNEYISWIFSFLFDE